MRYEDMKRLLILFILFLLVIFGAGCASKSEDTNTSNLDQEVVTPVDTVEVSDAEQQAEVVDMGQAVEENQAESAVSQPEESPAEAVEDSGDAQVIYVNAKYIDPEIETMRIVSNDPDISVESMDFIDDRDYAESTDWDINEQLRNDGSQPIYLGVYYGNANKDTRDYYYYLEPGESVWINDTDIDKSSASVDESTSYFRNLPAYHIVSHKTVVPDVCPELSNFKNIFLSRSKYLPEGYSFVDLHSVKYVVKNADKGWASLVITISSGDADARVYMAFTDEYGFNLGSDYAFEKVYVPAGQTVEAEMPITDDVNLDKIAGIEIKSYPSLDS
jgi:hypothetical protein